MKRSLLIISCSGAKTEDYGLVPAIYRYKGPIFPTLQKAIREDYLPQNLDILIISAEHGLLKSDTPIKYYDREMCPERANELRPTIHRKLAEFLNGKDYDQLFNALWQDYQPTLEGFDFQKHFRCVIPVESGRGWKMKHVKKWIIKLFEKEQGE